MKKGIISILVILLACLAYAENMQFNNLETLQNQSSISPAYNSDINSGGLCASPIRLYNPERSIRLNDIYWNNDLYGDGVLLLLGKQVIFYNNINPAQIDSVVHYSHDFVNLTYTPGMCDRYYYDASGEHILRIETYSYSGADYFRKTIYEYDAQQRLIKEYYYQMDNHEIGPVLRHIFNYVFGTDCRQITYKTEYSYPNPKYSIEVYTNDAQGRIVGSSVTTSIDSINWVDSDSTSFVYNTNDTSTGITQIHQLSYEHALNYLYGGYFENLYGMLDEYTIKNRNIMYDIDNVKLDFLYNNLNQLVSITESGIDYVNNGWKLAYLYSYYYNIDGDLNQYAYQVRNFANTSWNSVSDQYQYTWEEFTPNDNPEYPSLPDRIVLRTYPNPVYLNSSKGTYTFIEFTLPEKARDKPVVEIYNLKGQRVRTMTVGESFNSMASKAGLVPQDVIPDAAEPLLATNKPMRHSGIQTVCKEKKSGDSRLHGNDGGGVFYSTIWDCRDEHSQKLVSGIYIVKVTSGRHQSSGKMTILK